MYHELLSKIIEKQGELSDRAFAKQLGLSNVQWSAVRSGQKRMGRETLQAILKAFPDLKEEAEAYWLTLLEDAVA